MKTDHPSKKIMDWLPSELWLIILLSLPIKTLVQCTSVCKAWYYLITSPTFANIPLKHGRRDLLLIKKIRPNYGGRSEVYTLYSDGDQVFDLYVGLRLDLPFNPLIRRGCQIIGSCNGVICGLVDHVSKMDKIILWNPTIRKFLNLPSPEQPSPDSFKRSDLVFGFGFDPKTNDFKVVRIADYITYRGCRVPDLLSLLDIKLYSLQTGSWRNITHLAKDIEYCIPKGSPQAFLNRAAHWFGVQMESSTMVISFNFTDELFCCFETPADMSFKFESCSIKATAIQGLLSLVKHCEKRWTIWVMGVYGDSSSWTKRLDINLLQDFDRIIGVRKNGDFLIQMRRQLFSFEQKNAEGEEHDIQRELDLHIKNVSPQGCRFEDFVSFYGADFYPNPISALKYLGSVCEMSKPAHCESFVETLALLGAATLPHDENQFEIALKNITGVSDCNIRKGRCKKLRGIKIN